MKKIFRDTTILLLSIAWFGSLFFFFGCKRPLQTSTRDSSYVETVRDTTMVRPGAKVETKINLDSISHLEQGHWYEYFDSLNRVSIAYMRDRFGRLNLKAESKPATFNFPIKTKTYVIKQNTHTKETLKQTPVWNWLIIGGLGTLLLAILIGKSLKRLGA
jgi:hypothetical protein